MRYFNLSRSIHKVLFFATATFLLSVWSIHAQQRAEGEFGTVVRVTDGDTVVLENGEKLRLIGVDTPETHHPQKAVEYFGSEATGFTRSLVDGQKVWIETDPANAHVGHKDSYGRTLAYIWNERGKFINAEIIQQGYGYALTQYPFKYLETFRGLEQHARQRENGLWSKSKSSSNFRESSGMTDNSKRQDTDFAAAKRLESVSTLTLSPASSQSGSLDQRYLNSSSYQNGPIVGHTVTGKAIFEGPRGGRYHITSGGHKSYHSRSGRVETGKR